LPLVMQLTSFCTACKVGWTMTWLTTVLAAL
jgi:hypothetical protein